MTLKCNVIMTLTGSNSIELLTMSMLFPLQVKRAEERGAIGVVLYSDPDDYIAANVTTVYPDSWWIPPSAAPRGSILRGTGDPLTPGYPAICMIVIIYTAIISVI